MFVCETCAKQRHQFIIAISYGPCEVCGKNGNCGDVGRLNSLPDEGRLVNKDNKIVTKKRRATNAFEIAAENLRRRYYRRFPAINKFRWDLTSIKDRWYRRRCCHHVCARFGKDMKNAYTHN